MWGVKLTRQVVKRKNGGLRRWDIQQYSAVGRFSDIAQMGVALDEGRKENLNWDTYIIW